MGPAIDATGKSLFGDSWDGKEVYARDLPPLWGFDGWDRALLIDGGITLSVVPGHSGSSVGGVRRLPTRSRFEIEPASTSEYEAERSAAARHTKAVDWLRQRWWSGELLVYRFDKRMRAVPSKRWADESFFHWVIRHGTSNRSDESGHLFVRRSDLARALAPAPPSNQKAGRRKPSSAAVSRGRPKGSGSLERADAPLIEQMRKLIIEEECVSPTAAAQAVAAYAKGAGTLDSKVRRLVERYGAKYPT